MRIFPKQIQSCLHLKNSLSTEELLLLIFHKPQHLMEIPRFCGLRPNTQRQPIRIPHHHSHCYFILFLEVWKKQMSGEHTINKHREWFPYCNAQLLLPKQQPILHYLFNPLNLYKFPTFLIIPVLSLHELLFAIKGNLDSWRLWILLEFPCLINKHKFPLWHLWYFGDF